MFSIRVLLLLFLLHYSCARNVVWAAQDDNPGAQKPAAENYAGSDACRGCHDDIYGRFSESPHQTLLANTDPAKQGCEACHGPGAAHTNSNGDVTKIFRFSQAKPAAIRSRCSECHKELNDTVHAHHQISCLKCHSAHHYTQKQKILVRSREQLCRDCHDQKSLNKD